MENTKTGVSKWELSDSDQERSAVSDGTVVVPDSLPKSAPVPFEPKHSRPVAILPSQYSAKTTSYLHKAVPSMHSPPSYRYAPSTVPHSPMIRSDMPYPGSRFYAPKVASYSVPYTSHPQPYGYRSRLSQQIPRTRVVRYQPYAQSAYVNYPTQEYTQKKYVHPSNSYIFGKEIRKPAN
ncbi:hypothetical protein HK103_000975 [Boothiomyces macroporosus]|uniref:Uncharacterized protein n=1 Tax=Boothiomyces macroporosus TaxID=261099 RepID=A0AAD5UK95_9FUNG|nr:hypothetical protein HK103_000975 [Boothiomyces macroporosus]